MIIDIIDGEGKQILCMDLPSVPYKVGEVIDITIKNQCAERWAVDNLKDSYRVEGIEHAIRDVYTRSNRYTVCTTVVTVIKVVDYSKLEKKLKEAQANNGMTKHEIDMAISQNQNIN